MKSAKGLGDIFLPFQRKWLADQSEVKISDKSRQIGFSWTESFDSALRASQNEGGMDTWIIHLNEDSAREWIGDVAFWAKFLNAAAGQVQEIAVDNEGQDIKAFRIEFSSGFRCTALSSRPSNLRGKRGKVVIEEAAFHESLDELVKAAMAFLMWGGRVSIISTHNGEDSEYNQLLNECKAGKKDWSVHRCTFDEAVEQGLYKKICERTDKVWSQEAEDEYVRKMYDNYGEHSDEELRCIPRRGGTIFMPRILLEKNMEKHAGTVKWFEYDDNHTFLTLPQRKSYTLQLCQQELQGIINGLEPNCKTFFGQDFARSTNLSVMAVKTQERDMTGAIPLLLKLWNVPYEDQKWIADWIIKGLRKRTRFASGAIDGTGAGGAQAEYVEGKHHSVKNTVITQDWHATAWVRLKSQFQDGMIKLPVDGDLLDSAALVVKDKGYPHIPNKKGVKDSRGRLAHADDLMAICLAEYAAHQLPDTSSYKAVWC